MLTSRVLARLLPRSLTNRVFAVYCATLGLLLAGGMGLFLTHQFDSQVEQTQRASVMMIEVVAQAVQDSVVIGDYDTVRKTLGNAVQGSLFATATFIDLAGGVIIAESRPRPGRVAPKWLLRWLEDKLYEVNRSLSVGGKDYGVLRLHFDAPHVAGDIWSLTLKALGLGGLGLAGGLLLFRVLVARWLKGLDRLLEFDLSKPSPVPQAILIETDDAPTEILKVVELFKRTALLVQEREASRRALDNQKFALDQHAIVSITDPDGNITYANDQFCAVSGYPRADLLGRNHRLIGSGLMPAGFFENLWQTIGAGQVWRGELCNRSRHGSLYWVDATIVPLLDEAGQPEQYIAIRTNITGRKAIEGSLKAAKELAEQANRAKSQFLANMSHEIRTPLNAILGMLTLIQNTSLTARQLDYITKTEGASRSLLVLLNDILDFAKVEADKMSLDPRPFRLDSLLRDLSVVLSANVGAKPLEVLFDISPDLPRSLIGDDMRLQQILINLGGNAIKFTESGEVIIGVKLVERNDQGVLLAFRVSDTGIGIAPENRQHIFSGFSQAEASTTRRYGGTGLGLAICLRLVNLMGGQLGLESEPGKGSVFSFQVPFSLDATDADEPLEPERRRASVQRALIVDDNPTARSVLATMIRSLGWQADVAASGEEAIALAQDRASRHVPYQAIFLDWQMPGMDGWQTSQQIRRISGAGDASLVLMVTAHGREMLARRSAEDQSLLDGYLVKPVTASMLLDSVADARIDYAHPSQPGQAPGRRPERLKGMRVLLVEDNANNQQVARELLALEGAIVAVAGNGAVGVAAVEAADPPFDAVLMDLQMPVMDGYTATARLRQQPQHQSLPIIAMTANAMASDREASLAAGMNDHVGKPFELSGLVATLLRHTGRPAAAPADSVAPAPHPGAVPAQLIIRATSHGIALQEALQRMGDELGVYLRMLEPFIRDLPALPEQLTALLQADDRVTAGRLMHTFKGVAATLGAERLARVIGTTERQLADAGQDERADGWVAALRASVQDTTRDFEALMPALREAADPSSPTGDDATPPDPTGLSRDLAELTALLVRTDMQAVDVFEALRGRHSPHFAQALAPLQEAITALDFERAREYCAILTRRIAT